MFEGGGVWGTHGFPQKIETLSAGKMIDELLLENPNNPRTKQS